LQIGHHSQSATETGDAGRDKPVTGVSGTKEIAMKTLTLALALSLLAAPAFAKGAKKAHCMKDGSEVTAKNKKACTKAGGKWEKVSSTSDTAPADSSTGTPDTEKK
jgi:hypothetical protein